MFLILFIFLFGCTLKTKKNRFVAACCRYCCFTTTLNECHFSFYNILFIYFLFQKEYLLSFIHLIINQYI